MREEFKKDILEFFNFMNDIPTGGTSGQPEEHWTLDLDRQLARERRKIF